MEVAIKPQKEIQELLEGAQKVALIACKLCFKEFVTDHAEALEDLKKAVADAGKELVVVREADFLCNSRSTEQMLSEVDLGDVDAVITSCCGVGTQVVAALTEKPVIPFSDSQGYTGFEGFYPVDSKLCAACGQCVLNYTAGICPVAYCSKGLLNGPCGGAKNGKCEVDSEKDCIWLKIFERLQKQNRIDDLKREIRNRDFNRPSFSTVNEIAQAVTERRDASFYGGVYPIEHKDITEQSPIEELPAPDTLVIPLIQHIGMQCRPVVSVGDKVKVGQLIADSEAYVSAPIHSSVSGKVVAIEPRPHPVIPGAVPAVIIENDGRDELHQSCVECDSVDDLTPEEIIRIVHDRGIVGMGGAMFPTHVKMKSTTPIEVLILNGCECEPFLTADHRMMIERTQEIVSGVKLIAKALGAGQCIIAVEDNKPDAAERFRELVGEKAEVALIPVKYPQGAERMLVYRLTGRTVPKGGLPLDVGVVVSNVSTACAVYEGVKLGLPLTKRVLTVSGTDVKRPGNYLVRIGTTFSDLLRTLTAQPVADLPALMTIKMGGPMMGLEQSDLGAPIIKGTTGLTILPKDDIEPDDARKCIRCGRCVDVCPMELMPHQLWHYIKEENWQKLDELGIADCIECGCCGYVCSAKLPLVELIKEAKPKVKKALEGE